MRAGLATLPKLESPGFYPALDAKAARLAAGLRAALDESGVLGQINRSGSLLTLFFSSAPVGDYAGAKKSDTIRFASFFREMLARGVLLPPSQFEALFVSAAHTDADIDQAIAAARATLGAVPAAR
jgi:glutamate-1-semialdehyde 2,1-aminomutase